jgi:DNA anti-recombination protein RmuC
MEALFPIIVLAAVIVFLVVLLVRRGGRSSMDESMAAVLESLKDISAVQTQVTSLAGNQTVVMQNLSKLELSLKGLETKLSETSGNVRQAISKDVNDTRRVLTELKARFEDQTKREDEIHAVTRKIERVVVGARTRGESGENILAEAFAQFPAEMIDRDFRVGGGRVVEYAVVLPNGKRLPVDSKWSGAEALERIDSETDPEKVKKLESDLERDVQRKAKEVAGYIDPSCTTNIAIAAVPDSVYGVCRKVHIEAFKMGVLLMAYSMVVPYVLALYHMYLQFARSIDFENIEAYITKIERSLDEVDKILENRVARAGTLAANAYSECKQVIGSIRAATAFLRELPAGDEESAGRVAALGGSPEAEAGECGQPGEETGPTSAVSP